MQATWVIQLLYIQIALFSPKKEKKIRVLARTVNKLTLFLFLYTYIKFLGLK